MDRTYLYLFRAVALSLLTIAIACASSVPSGRYVTEIAYPNLSFTRPVDFQHPGDGSGRVFVVEQAGVIRVFENDASVQSTKVFLDIRDRVDDSGNEEGLLGLAFHPEFETNGQFFVDYTASGPDRTVISRFEVKPSDPDAADPGSEQVILTIGQPYSNHNGGQVSFGPDGMLYIAMGDGGSGGDPQGNGQNRSTLLGAILRIDVDRTEGGRPYAIPPDNPFAGNGNGYREEIFAYGLRNPWRFSFDSSTGTLWAGDVGQNKLEEIDIIRAGGNYGWNVMEGFECYNADSCNKDGLEPPVIDYPHEGGDISVTGGYVYRGSRLSGLRGSYIYADFGSGRIWTLTKLGEKYANDLLVESGLRISSFGIDASKELYICAFDGRIYRLAEEQGDDGNIPAAPVKTTP